METENKTKTRLDEANKRLDVARKAEYEASKRVKAAKADHHKAILKQLDGYDGNYINEFAEEIFEYANKSQLDPKLVYEVLRDAEHDAIHSHKDKNNVSSAEGYYFTAMDWIFQTGGGTGDVHGNAARYFLEKAIDVAKKDEEGKEISSSEKRSTAYQIVIDLLYAVKHAQQRDFWNSY